MDYPVRRLTPAGKALIAAIRISVLGLILFVLAGFLFKVHNFSRIYVVSYVFTSLALMVATRLLVRTYLAVRRQAGWDLRTRLVVGEGAIASKYIHSIQQNPQLGIRVVGRVSDLPGDGVNCFGPIEELPTILGRHPVDGVIIALSIRDPRAEAVMTACEVQGVPMEFLLDHLSATIQSGTLVHSAGVPRLVLEMTPQPNADLILKRVTDLVLSGLALVVLSPLLLAIAIAIKLDDGGPVIFSQLRTGLRGKTFRIHKFRSMVPDAELRLGSLRSMNEMSGPVFKLRDDPRITRVGRFLRRTSLDELPQLWNVFVGSMSIVGPRPPIPTEVDQYDPYHRRRLSVKPGITCLWQISGRNNIDFTRWVELDLDYIDNWSYLNDWKIIMKTIPVVWKRTGV